MWCFSISSTLFRLLTVVLCYYWALLKYLKIHDVQPRNCNYKFKMKVCLIITVGIAIPLKQICSVLITLVYCILINAIYLHLQAELHNSNMSFIKILWKRVTIRSITVSGNTIKINKTNIRKLLAPMIFVQKAIQ